MSYSREFTVEGERWTVVPRVKSEVRALDEAELLPSGEQTGLYFESQTGERRFFPWERPTVLREESLERLSDAMLRQLLQSAEPVAGP